MRETGADRFFKNPVRQLRALGASAPSVSVRRNSSWSTLISRQPVIVTGALASTNDDAGAAEALVTGPDSFAAALSLTTSSTIGAAVAPCAPDGIGSAMRRFPGFGAGIILAGTLTRGATVADVATVAATRVVAVGGVGTTASPNGPRRSGLDPAVPSSAPGAKGRRGTARAATTRTATAATAIIRGCVIDRGRATAPSGARGVAPERLVQREMQPPRQVPLPPRVSATADCTDSDVTGELESGTVAFSFTVTFLRCGFLEVFCARAPMSRADVRRYLECPTHGAARPDRRDPDCMLRHRRCRGNSRAGGLSVEFAVIAGIVVTGRSLDFQLTKKTQSNGCGSRADRARSVLRSSADQRSR